MNLRETAKQFWSRDSYPDFPFLYERRQKDLRFILKLIKGFKIRSLVDIGSGDGWLTRCLADLTDIYRLKTLDLPEYDIYDLKPIPAVDAVILNSVVQYVFEDDVLKKFLKICAESCKVLILKTPCDKDGAIIRKFSEELKGDYASRYRSAKELENLLSKDFKIDWIERAYPDSIESQFGTKQYYFICTPKS